MKDRAEAYGAGPESRAGQRGQNTPSPGLPVFIGDVKSQHQLVTETLLALTLFDSRNTVF